jgi:hypothetical protein
MTLLIFDTRREEWIDLDALYPEPEREPLPSLPHTCSDCGAYFKRDETDALREHQALCRTYMDRVAVVRQGDPPPPRRVPADYRSGGGYPAPGDRADIWRLWIENGRQGAPQLIARHSGTPRRPVEPATPPRMLGDPDPEKLARHVQLYGPEGAGRWLEKPDARVVSAVIRRRLQSHRPSRQTRIEKRPNPRKFSENA